MADNQLMEYVNLHGVCGSAEERTPITSLSTTQVITFELNSLYKINQITSEEKRSLSEENGILQKKVEVLKKEKAADEERIKYLEAIVFEERMENTASEQNAATIKQIQRLDELKVDESGKGHSQAEECLVRGAESLIESNEQSDENAGQWRVDNSHIADPREHTSITCQNLQNLLATLNLAQNEAELAKQESSKKQENLLSAAREMIQHMEQTIIEHERRSRTMGEMYDMLLVEKVRLEKEKSTCSKKLDILEGKKEKQIISAEVKWSGRFEVEIRTVECARCYELFNSTDDMKQSTCHYHNLHYVPSIEDRNKKFWPCCVRYSKWNEVPEGCKEGDHTFTNKCFKRNN